MRRRFNYLVDQFTERDAGATMVEYALLIAFIAIASIAVITIIGTEASSVFDKTRARVSAPEAVLATSVD